MERTHNRKMVSIFRRNILHIVFIALIALFLKHTHFTEAACPALCSCRNAMVANCKPGREGIPLGFDPHIRVVSLSGTYSTHNKIPVINQHAFASLQILQELRMAFCGITSIADEAFSVNQYLLRLDLSDNDILTISEKTFIGISRLRELQLSGNQNCQITEGTFAVLPNLQTLLMANMGLTRLDPKVFSNMTNLKRLDLHGNAIKKIDITLGTFFPHLEHLDISDNFLKGFTNNNKPALTNLKSLKLIGNPWQCNCDIKWLKSITSKPVFDPEFGSSPLICTGPDKLEGLPIVHVDDLELRCIPPTIVSCQTDQVEVYPMDPLQLSCIIAGDPFPDVSWTRPDGQRFLFSYEDQSPYIINDNGTLNIAGVTKLDGGLWTLQVFNNHGTQEQRIQVKLRNDTKPTTTTTSRTTSTTPSTTKTTSTTKSTTQTTPVKVTTVKTQETTKSSPPSTSGPGRPGHTDEPSKTKTTRKASNRVESSAEPEAAGGLNMMMIAAAGGGGVVLIGAICTTIYCIKRKKNKNKVTPFKNDENFDSVRSPR